MKVPVGMDSLFVMVLFIIIMRTEMAVEECECSKADNWRTAWLRTIPSTGVIVHVEVADIAMDLHRMS